MDFYPKEPLVVWTGKGMYCPAGDFYIDPSHGVDTAVITHAHSDHARRGSKLYICEASGVGLTQVRLGKNINIRGVPYREVFKLGDVTVSFHSAGHILGSSQVRIQRGSEVWVVSGDYKRDPDPSCEPFEVVKCETFITEATFGTPKYTWEKNQDYGRQIHEWWMQNQSEGKNSILFGYSLGKAQRILAELAPHATRPIVIHPTMVDLTDCYRREGRKLAPTRVLAASELLQGQLILSPPSILKDDFRRVLGDYKTAFASGWMQTGNEFGYGRNYDHGFVMSDHADWNDLNRTIEETGAKRVLVQHRNGKLIQHLRAKGLEARPMESILLESTPRLL